MTLVVAVAFLLAGARAFGPIVLGSAILGFTLPMAAWYTTRQLRTLAACAFEVLALVVNSSVAMLCAFRLSLVGLTQMVLISYFLLPSVLGFGVAWASRPTRGGAGSRRPQFLAWLWVVVLVGLPLTMIVTFWPLRLAFFVSAPALERLANRVAGGEIVRRPEWAGTYRVTGAAFDPLTGNVGIVIKGSAGRSGFVRLAPSPSTRRSFYPFFRQNFDEQMSERWWYINEQ
jgi:hypothetical protein